MSTPELSPPGPGLEERLRRDLDGAAEGSHRGPRRSSRRLLLVAAALVTLGGVTGAVVLAAHSTLGERRTTDPGATARWGTGATTARSAPPAMGPPPVGSALTYDLTRLASESTRIVVGRVVAVEKRGPSEASGGIAHVMARIRVNQSIKGPQQDELVAFDYDYGPAAAVGTPRGASFVEGTRVLLFLSDVAGTVHEHLGPLHWQVTAGSQGAYRMNGSEPAAPFTLADVQAAARRASQR